MPQTDAFGGAPNAFVAAQATKLSVLPRDRVALLGVAGPDGAMRALIRMADGTVISAHLGAQTALGRLIEISPAGVVVELASGNAGFLRPYPWGAEMSG